MVHKSRYCYLLLLLGHACWAYVTGRLAAHPFGVRPNFYLLLLLGMLPDIDLIFGVFDIQHRTLTHSVFIWSILFVPVFIKYQRIAIPYFVAIIQHILLGDLVVGRTSILWPIAELRPGLGFSILSPINLVLEAIGLALLFALVIRNKELSQRSLGLRVIVVAPLLAFVILASLGGLLPSIFLESSDARYLERNLPTLLENPSLQIAVFLHLALIALLLGSLFKFRTKSKVPGDLKGTSSGKPER